MSDDTEMTELGNNAAERLKSFVERWARLLDEIGDLQEDLKQVKAEAKAEGYDMNALGETVKDYRADEEKRANKLERRAIYDTYKRAIGLPTELDAAHSAAREAAAEIATATQRRKERA